MTSELKEGLMPCPFCGELTLNICETDYQGRPSYAVSCRTVDCHGAIWQLGYGQFATQEEAVGAWNHRHEAARESVPATPTWEEALNKAAAVLATFPTEGNRTKMQELEACYASLFTRMVELQRYLSAESMPTVGGGKVIAKFEKLIDIASRVEQQRTESDKEIKTSNFKGVPLSTFKETNRLYDELNATIEEFRPDFESIFEDMGDSELRTPQIGSGSSAACGVLYRRQLVSSPGEEVYEHPHTAGMFVGWLSACKYYGSRLRTPSPLPTGGVDRVQQVMREMPSYEHGQRITFEGCEYILVEPETLRDLEEAIASPLPIRHTVDEEDLLDIATTAFDKRQPMGMDYSQDAIQDVIDTVRPYLQSALPIRGEGWMPIESAPNDGTHYLAFGVNGYSVCHWDDMAWADGNPCVFPMNTAAYWQPLPPAPGSTNPGIPAPALIAAGDDNPRKDLWEYVSWDICKGQGKNPDERDEYGSYLWEGYKNEARDAIVAIDRWNAKMPTPLAAGLAVAAGTGELADRCKRLEEENWRLNAEWEMSNDALRIARMKLEEMGYPDLPFLDDGIVNAINTARKEGRQALGDKPQQRSMQTVANEMGAVFQRAKQRQQEDEK